MDITAHKEFFSELNWVEREQRSNMILCSFAAIISTITLMSFMLLYSKQGTASILNEDIYYFPHRNNFSSGYLAEQGYSSCQSQARASYPRLDHEDCTQGCVGNSVETPATADITWLVLQCDDAENTLYTEFAQGLFHGMGNGLNIQIVKRHWSF